MRLIIEGETEIRLLAGGGAGFEVEPASPESDFSPLHMLAASLATCTLSVLAGWAAQSRIPMDGLEIRLTWNYVDDPYRVEAYDMELRWPELPEDRQDAALRVAQHCTVEHTLARPTPITARMGGLA